MKRIIILMLSVIISISGFSSITINANAVGNYGVDLSRECYIPNNSPLNPYSKPQCTWYCWGRAYEKLGVSLPSGNSFWRNANTWDESAEANSQYTVGTEAHENSILVENSSGTGHVAFVEKVENGYAYISEGNYLGTEYHEDRINLSTMIRDSWSNHVLSPVRYIYLKCKDHKWDKGVITKQPTCKKNGEKTYTCTVCGETKKENVKASSKYHSYKVATCVKATLHANGKLLTKCKHCGKTVKSIIYHPKTIKLKKAKYTYKDKAIMPSVIIKNTKGKKISSKYYSVSYKNNKNVGIAKTEIKFNTRYSGKSKLKFMINPKGTSIDKLTAGVKDLTVKWKKQSKQTSGYQIQYSTNSKFSKGKKTLNVKNNNIVSKKIKKLKATTRYFFRIRTYKKIKSLIYYSEWSKVKKIKTKEYPYKMIKLKDGKKYKYDITGDGKKETIVTKTAKKYGKNNYYLETIRYIYINGKKRIQGQGYKDCNLWILTNKSKNIVLNQAVAGTGGTNTYYYFYNGKKFVSQALDMNNKESFGYYFESPLIKKGNFIVLYSPKYNWYSYVDSLLSFRDGWTFEVAQKYVILGRKIVKATKIPELNGNNTFISENYFDTGKTISSISKGDGPTIYAGDIIKIKSVIINNGYCYKIIKGKKTGWFRGSEYIRLTPK